MKLARAVVATLAAIPLVTALVACKSEAGNGPSSTVPGSSSTAGPSRTDLRTETAQLLAELRSGVATVRTARIATLHRYGGELMSVAGARARFTGGRLTDLYLSEHISTGTSRYIVLGERAWIDDGTGRGERPYRRIVSDSRDPFIRDLAKSLPALRADFSPTSRLGYLGAATSLRRLGLEDVRGTATTHYRLVVDARRLPDTVPYGAELRAQDPTYRVDIFVDFDGVPVRTVTSATSKDDIRTATNVFDLVRINVPVTIKAPRDDQVRPD